MSAAEVFTPTSFPTHTYVQRNELLHEKLLSQWIESSADEDGMAVFDGRISRSGEVAAAGTLTVFQPLDNSFVEGECARDG